MLMSMLEISSERALKLREGGVSAYVTKPFTPDTLVRIVRRALSEKV